MAQIGIRPENELQTRSRIVTNQLKDRDNCIVLKIDTQMTTVNNISPFGFHFELDKKRYKERKKQIRRQKITQWFSWLAYYHHKFGIRHIFLVLLLAAFVFIGGAIFLKLESANEITDLKETIVQMQGIIAEMTVDVINVTLSNNGTQRDEKVAKLIKTYYKTMLEAEGRFHGSVWHKAENLDMHLMWYYSSATFYSMTLFTTIGYGSIACQTFWGRALSVVYACIGIPLMLVVLGDIGELFQRTLTKAYIYFLLKSKNFRKKELARPLDEIFLPMWIALPLVLIYIISCTLVIHWFDHNEGNKPGIGFPEAFYFTFISLTTIGLGDVMPYNIQYSPFLAGAFLLGLALVSIVNTSIYAQLYDMFFTFVEGVEKHLERIHKEHFRGHGYRVFQDMEPMFRLLVCSFPHIAREAKEEWDDAVRESFRVVKKPKKTVRMEIPAHIRKRTISDVAAHDEEHTHPQEQPQTSRRRAPTLGAMGGFDLAKFRKMHEDRRAYERDKKAKNAMSVVESDASTEESESEAETETVDGSPPMGSSRTYLI
ncbi:hypothetical protein Y032_0377g261 [Ancylostoma ceylanicum]|uniref:Potassium channel domain-containing protein n=1 Tax=Ancylostoma ceylanicum TaxID=53326 RepID=A0A016RTL3_9BILA|nr:hypothetical protein Y032_0377g261 [Ancylostoma ceylanicum]